MGWNSNFTQLENAIDALDLVKLLRYHTLYARAPELHRTALHPASCRSAVKYWVVGTNFIPSQHF